MDLVPAAIMLILGGIIVLDLIERRISNISVGGLFLLVIWVEPFSVLSFTLMLSSLLIGVVLSHYKILGGGDTKLLAVVLYASNEQWLICLLTIALIGGGMSTLYWCRNYWLPSLYVATVPYGVAISMGFLLTAPMFMGGTMR